MFKAYRVEVAEDSAPVDAGFGRCVVDRCFLEGRAQDAAFRGRRRVFVGADSLLGRRALASARDGRPSGTELPPVPQEGPRSPY
jgi:hypothetical protein